MSTDRIAAFVSLQITDGGGRLANFHLDLLQVWRADLAAPLVRADILPTMAALQQVIVRTNGAVGRGRCK